MKIAAHDLAQVVVTLQEQMVDLSQFVIPPFHGDEKIEDWELVFRAAVIPLLLKRDGQKLAVGLLNGYMNQNKFQKAVYQFH